MFRYSTLPCTHLHACASHLQSSLLLLKGRNSLPPLTCAKLRRGNACKMIVGESAFHHLQYPVQSIIQLRRKCKAHVSPGFLAFLCINRDPHKRQCNSICRKWNFISIFALIYRAGSCNFIQIINTFYDRTLPR